MVHFNYSFANFHWIVQAKKIINYLLYIFSYRIVGIFFRKKENIFKHSTNLLNLALLIDHASDK